jgi:Leucine-rich repeat (LRR) protein
VLRLDDNHLTSLALLPPLNRLTELLVSNNRLTATASAAGGSGSATATPGSGENSTVPDRTNACLASLAVACPLLEVLDLSDNRLNLADDGSDDDGRAAAATACVALFAVPLASCAELRELSVGGNPCCAGTPASVLPSRSNASASGGAAADNATTASTASVSKWWFALREALPQLHALDELDTGRRQVNMYDIRALRHYGLNVYVLLISLGAP